MEFFAFLRMLFMIFACFVLFLSKAGWKFDRHNHHLNRYKVNDFTIKLLTEHFSTWRNKYWRKSIFLQTLWKNIYEWGHIGEKTYHMHASIVMKCSKSCLTWMIMSHWVDSFWFLLKIHILVDIVMKVSTQNVIWIAWNDSHW